MLNDITVLVDRHREIVSYYTTTATILWFSGLYPDNQKVHFAVFWIFWCKMKITQADAPTIRMDCHPIQTN